jgi:hypothetical protein
MTPKRLLVAAALLLSATTLVMAQAQPNCPGGAARGDCYGQPYSGAAGARCRCAHFGAYHHHHHHHVW